MNSKSFEQKFQNKISLLVFIWSALLFFINLQYNFVDEYDTAIFWLSILLMLFVVIYQIFFLKNHNYVLFEIFIVYLLLHLVYQVGYYGLRGLDSFVDYNFFNAILNNNGFDLGQGVDGWPMMHIFSSITTVVTKIDPMLIAKFLPSFISSIIILPIYLLAFSIYKDKKVALFSCVLYCTIPQFMSFEALFVRETFALFIMILFFYILYVSKQRNVYGFTLLSIILIPVIVFAHHFTSFMCIFLLALYLVVSKMMPYFYRGYVNIKEILSGRINIRTIFLAILVAILSYWMYHAVSTLEISSDIFYEAIGIKAVASYAEKIDLGSPIVTLRGNIIYYGFFLFHGLFSIILLIKLIAKRDKQKIQDAAFTLFFFFCMFCGFLGLYVLGSLIFPDRFLSFGWMFAVIPLTAFILHLKKNMFRKILVVLLISFVVFNLYNIDPEYYTGNISLSGDVATEGDYLIAEQINFSGEYYGYLSIRGAIYDVQELEFAIRGKDLGGEINFGNASTKAIINDQIYLKDIENIKEKSKIYYDIVIKILSYKNEENINKIYDLGNIYVLKGVE